MFDYNKIDIPKIITILRDKPYRIQWGNFKFEDGKSFFFNIFDDKIRFTGFSL
jgi:hypothetical protein